MCVSETKYQQRPAITERETSVVAVSESGHSCSKRGSTVADKRQRFGLKQKVLRDYGR